MKFMYIQVIFLTFIISSIGMAQIPPQISTTTPAATTKNLNPNNACIDKCSLITELVTRSNVTHAGIKRFGSYLPHELQMLILSYLDGWTEDPVHIGYHYPPFEVNYQFEDLLSTDGHFFTSTEVFKPDAHHDEERCICIRTATNNYEPIQILHLPQNYKDTECFPVLSADKKFLIVGIESIEDFEGQPTQVQIFKWSLAKMQFIETKILVYPGDVIVEISFSPNQRYVAIIHNTTIEIWDIADEIRLQQKLKITDNECMTHFPKKIIFSPNSTYMICLWTNEDEDSEDKNLPGEHYLTIYQFAQNKYQTIQAPINIGSTDIVTAIQFSKTGKHLIAQTRNRIHIYSVNDAAIIFIQSISGEFKTFLPDEKFISENNNQLELWQLGHSIDKPMQIIESSNDNKDTQKYLNCSVSDNGKYLACSTSDDTSKIWKFSNGQYTHLQTLAGSNNKMIFSKNSQYLFTIKAFHQRKFNVSRSKNQAIEILEDDAVQDSAAASSNTDHKSSQK